MLGSLDFLTPLAGLVALAALAPVAASISGGARAGRVRETLGLAPPPRRRDTVVYGALAATIVLLGLAAAQPVLSRSATQRVRSDAQVLFVLDISRSMAAARSPRSPTRLERAKAAARELRAAMPGVEAGVATVTDRILPNLLPVADTRSFDATVARSIRLEEPPPRETRLRATTLAALEDVPAGNYFAPAARRRVVVLLTDGETVPVDDADIARSLAAGPGISLVPVQVWDARESIYDAAGRPESAYRPDPTGRVALGALASATGARTYDEGALPAASARIRELLGDGPTRATAVRRQDDVLLAPFLAALALVPLGFVALRRSRLPLPRLGRRSRRFYHSAP